MENTLYVETGKKWRTWLSKYHDKVKEIWLIYYKKHTQKPSVPYHIAVEESLCFGWIDSTIKRIDDERYMQKFTPRTNPKNWSELNIERVNKLIAEKKMTEFGLAVFKPLQENKTKNFTANISKQKTSGLFITELKKYPEAYQNYSKLAPSHQNNYINWIDSAKKLETIDKRILESVRLLKENKKVGMK